MASDLDITTQLHLHPLMAWYGVKREIQGVDGQKLIVEIPAGVSNHTRLRLGGAGKKRGDQRGDFYVEINVEQPKFFVLQKLAIAIGSIALGCVVIAYLSGSILWDVWLVLGCLLVSIGTLILCGMIQPEYSGKQVMGGGAFIFLSVFPALLINRFGFDIGFTWTAAFACATIGGVVGGLSLQPKPKWPSLLAGIVAGNSLFGVIYFYSKHRTSIWNYEIALLIVIGFAAVLGLNRLLKKFF